MSRNAHIALLAGAAFVVAAAMAPTASPAADTGGPIHGVVVLSDQVEDVSSLEAIAARLTSLASGNAKAEEIFRLGAKFRHQSDPPTEYLGGGDHPHDPVKIMNVYGYCQCCCASAMLQALARSAGLPARGWSLAHHSVGEVQYDGGWHMYDLSLINFFRTDAGIVASVEDLIAQRDRLTNHEHSRYIDEKGFLPAHSQWIGPGSMGDYEVQDSKLYEYPYTLGHRATISLRAGESLVRRWGNRGLHVDQDQPHKWDPSMTQVGAKGNQAYLTEFYPGYQMGLVGNGELNYRPDLASESSRNLAWGAGGSSGPALRLAAAGKGEIVIPFSSGYVFLGGRLKARFFRRGQEAALRVLVSTNNGLDWKEIWSAGQTGSFEADIDLGPAIYRRYAYQLKIEMTGRAA
ncbi:MAG TPA: transglutaminase domain-containing protein, partial [Candidatus Polarisedimenticolia bacterium]|nr:transglutaminase domain-containing protein [Candidatus Polarisedimenticolia bacterium]